VTVIEKYHQNRSFVILLFLTTTLIASFTLTRYSGFASIETNNNTSNEPEASQDAATATSTNTSTTTNIVLVHGSWVDGSFWRKVIPILQNAGHRVIAVQLPLHSLTDNVVTVNRAVELVGGPTILVGHSYGGFVITNAGYIIKMSQALFILLPLLLMRVNLSTTSCPQNPYLQDFSF
jgi:hypothetical protein